ncbi:MAG TPA: TIGR04283 family arsenosugar biosynthesis glycosyltransferase [Usitatibacter sp.]|nr:TIGR04283 family arsenosugar biosynthesis glycosyltransferase [Usitatibacter sp.]
MGEALSISIVMPVLDEAAILGASLAALAPLAASGAEVIVVDGGSGDGSDRIATQQGFRVVAAPRGRASQMNAGAKAARGDALVFLHADTRLPEGALGAIGAALAAKAWGRFDVSIAGGSPLLLLVAATMNLRSRLTGIATGDQAIFVRRDAFERVGGFPQIPLMEDVALSDLLKRAVGRPRCLADRATTSARRWEKHGTLRTIFLMWRLRAAYAMGADPRALARAYETRQG